MGSDSHLGNPGDGGEDCGTIVKDQALDRTLNWLPSELHTQPVMNGVHNAMPLSNGTVDLDVRIRWYRN